MSYRSYEQSTTTHSPTMASQSSQRKKNITPGSLLATSQAWKKSRFLLPLGAVSATLALGISTYTRGERLLNVPYKIPFVAENSFLKDSELKRIFQCGNSQHIYNSLAIMASPFTSSKPLLTSSLLLSGITLFCGTQYYRTFSKKPQEARPALIVGGLCLLTGWLTFLL